MIHSWAAADLSRAPMEAYKAARPECFDQAGSAIHAVPSRCNEAPTPRAIAETYRAKKSSARLVV